MDRLLPFVKGDVGKSIAREFLDKNDSHIEKELKKLDDENPNIATFIRRFANNKDNPMAIKWCAVCVYLMLKSQAECEWMEKSIKL